MITKIRKETTNTNNVTEQVLQLRIEELVYEEITRRYTNNRMRELLQGKTDPIKIRAQILRRKQKELKRTRIVLKNLEKKLFIIDRKAHTVANSLAQHLATKFPDEKIQLVLMGSSIYGGAYVQKQLVVTPHEPSDFDCGILLDGIIDPMFFDFSIEKDRKIYLEQRELIKMIGEEAKQHMEKEGLSLCWLMSPTNIAIPTINNVTETVQMLRAYFLQKETEKTFNGLYYFYPTYPKNKWETNIKLIQEALKEIRKQNKKEFRQIIGSIKHSFSLHIQLKGSHFAGKIAKDINSAESELARSVAQYVSELLREIKTEQIVSLKKPNYLIR